MADSDIKIKMISVVRNFEMYDRLVKNNQFNQGAEFVAFDNNKENLGISARYNSFLEVYDYSQEAWFVFCHEDWEVKENLAEKLKNLDKNCLYGPIGRIAHTKVFNNQMNIGQIECSNKDGSDLHIDGLTGYNLMRASTFDCQCLIVHSSLVRKYHLRFDENLLFDLYVEDFCINAREKFNIPSKILQLKCHHWSGGKISDTFLEKYNYLINKYAKTKEYYTTTCSNIIIGNNWLRPFYFFRQKLLHGNCKIIKRKLVKKNQKIINRK